ncbi:DegV family protein [Brevibacterium spongiae]|uniref:DegV family protein n=1 Tax=Brevibacterium spongiae TaxID=2909672 RepID=A0ABY5SJU9_9MICO|nr:DegV family protein [Brevibacterium spongiae]UVI34555.1 DegV family protein [Brevibacterium spongiae]
MKIGLVTDSTAQLSSAEVDRLEQLTGGLFAAVPLTVLVGGVAFADGEISAGQLCEKMTAGDDVSTSMATPTQFAEAYSTLRSRGAEAIIVITMSGDLSGTRDSAVNAAESEDILIDVVDSRSTSAGQAGAVEVAVAGIRQGLDVESIAGTVADWCASETRTVFVPGSLEHLRRGGRIGAAASLLGRALQIVPVLGLNAGVVVPLARVRTRAKALDKIVALSTAAAEELSEHGPKVAVEIQQAEGEIDDADVVSLTERLSELGVDTRFRTLSTIITAHVGPGTIGVSVQTTP